MEQFQHLQDLNIYSSCRTCLENLNEMEMHYEIFTMPDLQAKLTACSSLSVEPGDGLPTSLCESCHTTINNFYIFQQMCISARARFQNYINSERKPFNSNNPMDFMTFTVCKKENEEEDHMSLDLYSKLIEAEPSFKMQNEVESSSNNEAEELEECQSPYDEYNTKVKDTSSIYSSRINQYEGNLNDVVCYKKSNASLNKINFECNICKKCFRKKETLGVHMRLHEGLKAFPCQLCDKSYSRLEKLKLHIQDKHEIRPDENVPCTELGCDRILSSKQTLRQHIRDIHWTNERKPKQYYICEDCGKLQTSLDALKNHRYLHTSQQLPHECPQCNKRFITKNILKEHINRHDGTGNYICPHCRAKKTTWRDLKIHINSHTKKKKYPCQYCDMVYYRLHNVNRHKRIVHEGIKDFPCSYCDKSFGRVETKKHHEMTHTGEKPHECNICHKKFIQFVSLKKHQKLHLDGRKKLK